MRRPLRRRLAVPWRTSARHRTRGRRWEFSDALQPPDERPLAICRLCRVHQYAGQIGCNHTGSKQWWPHRLPTLPLAPSRHSWSGLMATCPRSNRNRPVTKTMASPSLTAAFAHLIAQIAISLPGARLAAISGQLVGGDDHVAQAFAISPTLSTPLMPSPMTSCR